MLVAREVEYRDAAISAEEWAANIVGLNDIEVPELIPLVCAT